MISLEDVAKATLKIECGKTRGSAFQFIKKNIVITNFHVVKSHIEQKAIILANTELGSKAELKLIAYSPEEEFDYAILGMGEDLAEERIALEPKLITPNRGTKVCFSGFPHGIDDLLVQVAHISGPFDELGFYIDGSVNAGNSGGPIVDINDMKVIGIVTQRRFLGGIDLYKVNRNLNEIYEHFQNMGKMAQVKIVGLDFGRFAQLISSAFAVFREVLEANANSGIGIGYRIEFVMQKLKELKLDNLQTISRK
jgi:hypothetical protein